MLLLQCCSSTAATLKVVVLLLLLLLRRRDNITSVQVIHEGNLIIKYCFTPISKRMETLQKVVVL